MYKCTRLWGRLGDIFAFPFFPLKFILVVISSSLNKSLVIVHRKFPAEHVVAQANCWTSLLMTNSQFPGTISFGDLTSMMVAFAGQDINMELFVTAKSREEGMEFSSRSVSLAGMDWSLESSSTSSGCRGTGQLG